MSVPNLMCFMSPPVGREVTGKLQWLSNIMKNHLAHLGEAQVPWTWSAAPPVFDYTTPLKVTVLSIYTMPAGNLQFLNAPMDEEELSDFDDAISDEEYKRTWHRLERKLGRRLDTGFGTLQKNVTNAHSWQRLTSEALCSAQRFLGVRTSYAKLITLKRL